MPIDLNTFRNAVANANNDSFIRMSGSRPGEIVNYGTSFLGRVFGWYRHGTVEQNQDIREKLYHALEGEGSKIQAGTLESIRFQLGIDAQGKSVLVNQLTAREVKIILADIEKGNANAKTRQDFLNELSHELRDSFFTDKAANMLGLNDPMKRIEPLTDEEKNAIRHELKKAGLAAFDSAKNTLQLPSIPELRTMISDQAVLNSVEERYKLASMEGKVAPTALTIVKGDINAAQMRQRFPEIETRLHAAIEQLSRDTGEDCSALEATFKAKLLKKIETDARSVATVIRDPARFDTTAINQSITNFIHEHQEIIQRIKDANPPFTPAVKKGLLELATTDLQFVNFEMAKGLAEFANYATDLFEYSNDPNPTMADFLTRAQEMEHRYDNCAKTVAARLGAGLNGEDLQALSNRLASLSRTIYREAHGTAPHLSAPLRKFIMRFMSEMQYLLDNSDQGTDPAKKYCYSKEEVEGRDGVTHFCHMMAGCFAAFAENQEVQTVPTAQGLSDDISDFLVEAGLLGKRIENPYGKVIDQKLGSLFQHSVLEKYQSDLEKSTDDTMTDYQEMFEQVAKDLTRSGTSMKLGGNVISRIDGTHIIGGIDAIRQFFEADPNFGINAARVISTIAHQGLLGEVLASINSTGEASGGYFQQMAAFTYDVDINRMDNGHYSIKVQYTTIPEAQLTFDGNITPLDPSRTRISMDFTLELGFHPQYKIASMEFSEKPRIHAELYKSILSLEEFNNVNDYHDPENGFSYTSEIYSNQQIMSDPTFKTLMAKVERNPGAVTEYLKGKIIDHKDEDVLFALGFDSRLIQDMCFGIHPEARLTKDLMVRLTGKDRTAREIAFNELTALYQKHVDSGWALPKEFDLDDMALATVGGLTITPGAVNNTDFAITRKYIKNSQDPQVRGLPAALNSTSTQRVALAKAFLQTVIIDARRALGLGLLRRLPNNSLLEEEVDALKKAPNMDVVQQHLENIILRNEKMDASLSALKNMAIALK